MTAGVVTIRFTSKLHIGSRIMAVAAQSEWANHCMLFDDGMVYEAVCWHGVRYVQPGVSMRGVRMYQDMDLVVPNIEGMRAFLREQLGADYDWAGAAGIPVLRSDDWQDPAKWWCSELIIAGLAAGGLYIIDFNELERGTPNDLFQYPAQKAPLVHVIS